jgi:hypothetical protein
MVGGEDPWAYYPSTGHGTGQPQKLQVYRVESAWWGQGWGASLSSHHSSLLLVRAPRVGREERTAPAHSCAYDTESQCVRLLATVVAFQEPEFNAFGMAPPISTFEAPGSIFELSSACSKLFDKYLQHPDAASKSTVEDFQCRFNLWTAYIGAFASPGASLDDRLRFHEEIKAMVMKLLIMLRRNLQSGPSG